jgi:hypothetical protein
MSFLSWDFKNSADTSRLRAVRSIGSGFEVSDGRTRLRFPPCLFFEFGFFEKWRYEVRFALFCPYFVVFLQ